MPDIIFNILKSVSVVTCPRIIFYKKESKNIEKVITKMFRNLLIGRKKLVFFFLNLQ